MIGLDLLGLGHKRWPIAATLKAINRTISDFAVGVFDDGPNLFGDPRKNLQKLINTGKVKLVRVQLTYTKGHDLTSLDFMDRRLPLWKAFAAKNPKVEFYVSHTTEHYETDKRKLIERMKLIESYGLIPVNNPEPGKGALLPGYINETHKDDALMTPYFASQDGCSNGEGWASADTASWVRKHRGAIARFVWSPMFNLNDLNEENNYNNAPYIPPAERTDVPNIHDVLSAIAVAEPQEPCLVEGPKLQSPEVYKMSGGTGDDRDRMPCFIGNISGKKVSLVTINGDTVGFLKYFGPFNNLRRYYSGAWRTGSGCKLWGYQIANRAKKLSGSPWVWLVSEKGQKIALVHPAYRNGYFR